MKYILLLSILISMLTLPAFGALDADDLNQIRLLIQEELDPIKQDITQIKQDVANLKGRIEGVEKIITWLMVLIVVVVGVPQAIAALRSRKEREQDQKIEALTREIEALKQRTIVSP